MLKSTVAREYRSKYPDMPTLKLARIIYNQNKSLFKDIEDTRGTLRYIEGKSGIKNKKGVGDKSYVKETSRPYNPYNLPKTEEVEFKPYKIKGFKRILLLSDIHVPYHNIESLTQTINFAKKEKPDLIFINGDLLDCYQLSRFGKDPRKRNFAYELDTMKELINVFQKQFKAKIVFKLGNHEERYEHFLYQKAGELLGVEEIEIENIIKARANGIDIIKDKRIVHANKLNIIHGHEFSSGFFSPVNIARGLSLRAKASAIQGHNHQTSEHTSIDINGKVMTTWSTGCLCELHPEYSPINNWNHGFAIIDLDNNGQDFEVRNKRIYKGKIL